jgi:hypothetical protein
MKALSETFSGTSKPILMEGYKNVKLKADINLVESVSSILLMGVVGTYFLVNVEIDPSWF